MAKITVAGDAVVVTSALKLEDIKTVAKYRPNALVLKGGEDNKEEIFRLAAGTHGSGSINKYGAEFTSETRDDAKLATMTTICVTEGEDIKEIIADQIGGAILNLNKIETTIPAVLTEIAAEKAQVLESITVA